MIEEVKTVKLYCDACGEEINNNLAQCTEGIPAVISYIVYEEWYRGSYEINDLCEKCNKKILRFLEDNNMIRHIKP